MKLLHCIFSAVLLFSCSETIEKNCFESEKEKSEYVEEKPYTVKEIIAEKPSYLEIEDLKNFRTFKEDSLYTHEYKWKNYDEIMKQKETELKDFKNAFHNAFMIYKQQDVSNTKYALGRNDLGYWLLKIADHKPSAYFLGLSFSHYYFNEIQNQPLIKDDFLQIEGSLVQIIKVAGLPGYDDYSAIADGKMFKVNLKELTKDTDQDGYNDIFERCFGLNPDDKDSDGDGINDFADVNPMYKSEKNKFTELYEMLLPTYAGTPDFKKDPYYFEVFKTDCDYFHQITPGEYKVLFIPETEDKQSQYVRVTDVYHFGISKIRKNKEFPERFYINKWDNSSSTDYAAEYKNGKWELEMVGGMVI